MLRKLLFTLLSLLFITACNDAQITSNNSLSQIDSRATIVIYSMNNYTDTPHAGMRAANIAEGFGRYHKKDKIKFYRYSNGSLLESIDWIRKSQVRGLITKDQFDFIINHFNELPKELNQLIKYTNIKLKY